MARLLAADIGGTKSDFRLIEFANGRCQTLREASLASARAASAEALVRTFLGSDAGTIALAALAVAGPVSGRCAELPNLPWNVDATRLEHALGIARVALLNDLEATACGIPELPPEAFETLNAGVPDEGPIAVIAAGTGLGEAVALHWRLAGTARRGRPRRFRARRRARNRTRAVPVAPVRARELGARGFGSGTGRSVPLSGRSGGRYRKRTVPASGAGCGRCRADRRRRARRARSRCSCASGARKPATWCCAALPPAGRMSPVASRRNWPRGCAAVVSWKPSRPRGRYAALLRRVPVRIVLDPKAALHGAALRAIALAQAR